MNTKQNRSRAGTVTGLIALMLAILAVAAVSGLAIGVGGPMLGLGISAAILGFLAFFVPLSVVFWLMMAFTFVLVGPAQYFGGVPRIFWLPYLMGLFILLRAIVEHSFAMPKRGVAKPAVGRPMWVLVMLSFFALSVVASSVFNLSPFFQVLLSSKEYFFLWGAGLAVYWGLVQPNALQKLLDFGHWYLLLQLPVILYQRFVVAAQRAGASVWDSVVGLMGGDPNGGGASAAMALCAIIVITYNLASWRVGVVGTSRLLAVLAMGMASILLAEVKLAIFLLPLACCLVYGQDIVRRPFVGLTAVGLSVTLGLTILMTYQTQFSGAQNAASQSVGAYVGQVIERNSGDQQINFRTGEMGRVAALRLWLDDDQTEEPLHLLLGHGIGASRIGVVVGEVAQRFRFEIGRSSVAVLLWEGGLVAAVSLVLALALAARRGYALAQAAPSPIQAVVFRTSAIGLTLTLVMLPYGPDFISVAQAQLLAILMFASILGAPSAGIATRRFLSRRPANFPRVATSP
jgi:hypothetical protein